MPSLQNLFFKSLPSFFEEYDSYKDQDGKGLLERYLESFQTETEESLIPINNMGLLKDPLQVLEDYLAYLSEDYGKPPTIFKDTSLFRKVLKDINFVKPQRGTEKGAINFFLILGTQLELTFETYSTSYDNAQYNNPESRYDRSISYCAYYTANIIDPDGNLPILGQEEIPIWAIENLLKIFEYLLPINAFLERILYNGEEIITPTQYLRKYSESDEDLREVGNTILRSYVQ